MANAPKPERDFCASCGFPLRGHRCDTCGRGREPLPIEEGRRQEVPPEGEAFDITGLERAFEAFQNNDLPRGVGHVIAADGESSVRSFALSDGPGWAAVIRGMAVFTAINTETGELSVETPIARIPRVQRVAMLRLALELCAQELVAARFCLRDDLLLLRVATKLNMQSPIALRNLLREMGTLAARYTELFAVSFDARPALSEDEKTSAGFDALGHAKRLRFGPGTNRSGASSANKAAALAARRAQAATAREPEAATAPRAAPPRSSEAPTKPVMRSSSAPPPPPPLGADLGGPNRDPISSAELQEPRRSEVSTTPIRRLPPLPAVPQMPPARSSEATAPLAPLPRTSEPTPPPPRASRPGPAAMPAMAAASDADVVLPRFSEDRRRNAQTMPEPIRPVPVPVVSGLPARGHGARPMLELEAPSRRPNVLIPAVTGENALLPADRLAAMLRQAQTLAALTLEGRPGSMSWLMRATVFRAVYEYRDALPDAVAHLYRCTGIGRDVSEPALTVMERVASARCQVPAEKPLTIEPFTTAPQAKEHVARYILEIERSPSEAPFRHFLALGALSELLVRAKLPAQTEQRLREIVNFAQREGPKPSAFDLMMTSLQRISGG